MAGTSAERTATLAGADADPFDMVEVEGYDGEPVMTATSFNDFRLTLEHMAADWAPDCTLINATEGGAKIHGWQQARLQDVLAQLPEIGLDVETRLAAHEDCDIQADRGQRTLALMDTLKNQLDAVASLCEQCLAQIDRCLRAPTQKNLAALEPIESKLKATARTIAPLTLATQHQLTVIVSRTPAVKDLKGSLALSRTLYAVIGTEAKALLQAFND